MGIDNMENPTWSWANDLDFQTIATDWYTALSLTAHSPFSYEEVRDRLAGMAHDATKLLHETPYLTAEAELIGSMLADLNYEQGDVLGISIKLLSKVWISQSSILNDDEKQLRMALLLGDLANGYIKSAAHAMLGRQETIREAQLVALGDLRTDLHTQRDLLRITAERLQTLHDVESGILTAQSAEAIAEIALTQIKLIIPCHTVAIVNTDFELGSLVVVSVESPEGATAEFLPFDEIGDEGMRALQQNRSLIVNDIGAIENRSYSLETIYESGQKSLMAVPMTVRDQLLGILVMTSAEIGTFTEQHNVIARQIADSVAVALHNRRLLETEQKARQEAEILREVAASLGSSLEREELLDYILVQLEKVIPFDGAVILLQSSDVTQLLAHRGFESQVIDSLVKLDDIPFNIQKVVEEKIPVIVSDTRLDPGWVWLPGAEHIRCWLGVPLISQGEFIGFLGLDKDEPGFYQQADADLALAFANHASVAINNAHLYHEIQQQTDTLRDRVAARTRELSTLYEIAAITSRPVGLQSVLEEGLAQILVDLAGQSGTIHVLDRQSGDLHLITSKGLAPDQIEQLEHVAAGTGSFQDLLTAEEPIVISSGRDDSEFAACLVRTPMKARGEVLGILSLYCDQHHATQDQVKLLGSVADQLGIAVDNAELRRQSRQFAVMEERERLGRDLHDSATQSLFSLTLFAAAAREKISSGQLDRALQHLDDIRYTANQTHRELRLLLYELGASQEIEEGLVQALERRLRAVEGRSGIHAFFNSTNTVELTPQVQQTLYQIASESLNNALKHAAATSVIVEVRNDNNEIILMVKDDGRGFNLVTAKEGAGMGLTNMTMRAVRMGGELSIVTAVDQGTEIIARIPRESAG